MANRKSTARLNACLTLLVMASQTYADVELAVRMPTTETAYSGGDIISLEVGIAAEGSAVAGIQLDVACESDAVRIRSINFDPGFPLLLSQDPDCLPAQRVSVARGRALGASAPGTGPGSALATIELEVMTDSPFTTHVRITAHASTIGRHKAGTIVQTCSPADLCAKEG